MRILYFFFFVFVTIQLDDETLEKYFEFIKDEFFYGQITLEEIHEMVANQVEYLHLISQYNLMHDEESSISQQRKLMEQHFDQEFLAKQKSSENFLKKSEKIQQDRNLKQSPQLTSEIPPNKIKA